MTKKNPRNENMRKVYREYARIKFKKYKLQFPRLRQNEIVVKILREWESLDQESKSNLQKQFTDRSGAQFLEISSSSQKRSRKEQARKKAKQNSRQDWQLSKQKKKKSPKIRKFELSGKSPEDVHSGSSLRAQRLIKQSSDFNRSDQVAKAGKSSTPDKDKNVESSSDLVFLQKSKKIAKQLKIMNKKKIRTQEINFKRYYFDKLSSEHPTWDKSQSLTIVKLLWARKLRDKKKNSNVSKKGLSGRQLYRRTKISQGLLSEQVKQLWKSLPHQSKRYWQIKGKGKPNKSEKTTGKYVRKVLNSGRSSIDDVPDKQSSFGWMQHQIS